MRACVARRRHPVRVGAKGEMLFLCGATKHAPAMALKQRRDVCLRGVNEDGERRWDEEAVSRRRARNMGEREESGEDRLRFFQ